MNFARLSGLAAAVAISSVAMAADITGIATVSKSETDKAAATGEDGKAPGVVVWVENVKDAKTPDSAESLSQKDGQFAPRLVVAVAGQTVKFPNDDNIAHNVFSMSVAKKFNLGIYPKGESKEVVFEKPGVIDVFCSLHRHMHAQIVVVPSVHYAVAPAGEAYTIKNVPAGTYKVTAWSNGCTPKTTEVTVTEAGGKAEFALAQSADAKAGQTAAAPTDK